MLVRRMKGDVEYQKDKLGAVAMHNLIIQKRGNKENPIRDSKSGR